MLEITYLADHPHLVPTLAHWHHEQWGRINSHKTLADRLARLQGHLQRRAIPTTFVALANGEPVGCASLVLHDLPDRVDLTPWLASVYVLPQRRHQGIGRALVRRVEDEARALGVPTLYLYTPDRQQFYAHLGWSVVEERVYRGEVITLMELKIKD
ncbi:GNAT family N-acetyltransferase [Litorilinea aerophila]|uniref:GNAT family N-acetyltransferase n=1 Tax=Litorilinea aerophila TaxID=1204385 RepID=A0A540VJ02_9CHLR|nr:GNAT family N-acetyltransferase [Litorilinea aerophila]MCC9075614.1 GNAT family N-acetyltransferase [Litorilinea aerophila]OUC08570.1 hypothetical protein RY27_08195 [Litorilinea aerophila]GIV79182.1 MAG: N-acetyltransferase GCN5 [Litorilinea sp.]